MKAQVLQFVNAYAAADGHFSSSSNGNSPSFELSIVGHSFGAGLADVAALDLAGMLRRRKEEDTESAAAGAGSGSTSAGITPMLSLSPNVALGVTHTFGDGHMGNAAFARCFNDSVSRVHGYFR